MLLQNVVLHYIKNKLNILCVRGAGEMRVNIGRSPVVDVNKHLGNVLSSLHVVTFRSWGREGEGEGRREGGGGGGGEKEKERKKGEGGGGSEGGERREGGEWEEWERKS